MILKTLECSLTIPFMISPNEESNEFFEIYIIDVNGSRDRNNSIEPEDIRVYKTDINLFLIW